MKDFIKVVLAKLHLYAIVSRICRLRFVLADIALSNVCRCRYKYQLKRLREKWARGEKIKVMFIVSDISKWKCQSVYDNLKRNPRFEPIVGISAWNTQAEMSDDEFDDYSKKIEDYFKRLGDRYVVTVKTHPRRVSNLSEFSPDIVIYGEQWHPPVEQGPVELAKRALVFLMHYYVTIEGDPILECYQQTEKFSYGYFVMNKYWAAHYRRYMSPLRCCCQFVDVGHPALDSFNGMDPEYSTDDPVIFAPHFAFKGNVVSDVLIQSTFDWSGKLILEYAKSHPEIKWAWKPHPLLRKSVTLSGLMTEKEIDDYYHEWESIATFCYDGSYQDMFKHSRAMITDCGSFLSEYAATGRPLIRLKPVEFNYPFPEPSQKLVDSFYEVTNPDEMQTVFETVLVREEDSKRKERIAVVDELKLSSNNSALSIETYFERMLKG